METIQCAPPLDRPLITVVTLCLKNPEQLKSTLLALPGAVVDLPGSWELLIVDGSDDESCRAVAESLRSCLEASAGRVRYIKRSARGIYEAMNAALNVAEGRLVGFMHAGDRYLPGAITALVCHWMALKPTGAAAVFGQAWVQPPAGLGWLTPAPQMRNLRRWLRLMVPCHQAFLFERNFARRHPYSQQGLLADRQVMRAALAAVGSEAYLRQPVCVYDLTGVSSQLPDWKELRRRWSEPQRNGLERGVEVLKFVLLGFGVGCYPALMRWRALLWGWLCRC